MGVILTTYYIIGMILQVGDPYKTFTTVTGRGAHPMCIPDALNVWDMFLYLPNHAAFLEPMYIGNTFIY